jgi:alkanesulfonate monooxygenase SsuD/methylene tetrahydromethanopterin reductase-like flavin-dependent oxidoreductase (luciferase family)
MTGTAVTFHGRFFDLDEAVIMPPPAAPVPVIVGGRSDAAVRRAGRLGDGWLGIWNSPRRFAAAAEIAAKEAASVGRPDPPARHAMQVWCGLADPKEAARGCLAPAMETFYQLPFERFERYCPYGTADDVAESSRPTSTPAAGNSTSSRSHLITTRPLPELPPCGDCWHAPDRPLRHRARRSPLNAAFTGSRGVPGCEPARLSHRPASAGHRYDTT